MSKIQPESFADLLDPDYQDHVIEAMKKWCLDRHYVIGAQLADLVDEDISRPLRVWIDETHRKREPGNYSDIEAAKEFAVKADDIAYILRYKIRPLYLEHVTMLDDVWTQFQRSIAYHLHIETRVLTANLPAAVAGEIQRRIDEAKQRAEAERQKGIEKWSNSGVAGSKENRLNRTEVLIMLGRKVLEEENRNEIRSIRSFAKKIANRVKEGNFLYETSTGRKEKLKSKFESIRKSMEIEELHKEYFNNN